MCWPNHFPDVVIIATGGLPHTGGDCEAGNDLWCRRWDILSGDVKPGSNVLLYDDAGRPCRPAGRGSFGRSRCHGSRS
jgi:hypothetical protein